MLVCAVGHVLRCFAFTQEDKREEVKEWVLAVSMDQKVGLLLRSSAVLPTPRKLVYMHIDLAAILNT